MAASGLVLVPVEVILPTSLHGSIPSLEPIQIYLATPGSNSVIPMRVLSSDTIASVKLRIQAYKGFYTKHQRLVYGGRELDRDNKTITDYGVSHGEILHLVLRLSDLIDVTVKTSGGKEYLFQVEKTRNVGDLKRRISEKEGGLAPDAQQLVLRGQNLEDQRCVDDLCLHDDAVVHLYVRRTAKVRTRYVGRDVELSITAEELVVRGKKGVVNAEKENVQALPQKKYTIRQLQPSYNAGYYVKEVSKSQEAKQTLHVLEQARGILPFQIPDILLDILAQAKAGIQGGYSPTLAAEGSGGSYFLKSSYGVDNVAIFKPVDEEPCAVNNPRGFSSSSGGEGLKKGTRVGEGAFREVAAYLLDHPIDGLRRALGSYTKRPMGFAGVPPTMMVRCAHDAFHYAPDSYDSVKKAKWGSLQQFVHAFSSCEEMGSASFDVEEVHKIAVLDMRLANTDRNGGNILVCRDENNSLRLVPIDHGYCLPEKFEDITFEWLYWSQAEVPFSESTTKYIAMMDAEKDIALLRQAGWSLRTPCKRVFRVTTMLLKKGAAAGLTPYVIGSMMCRETLDKKSLLEEMVEEVEQKVPINSDKDFMVAVSSVMDVYINNAKK